MQTVGGGVVPAEILRPRKGFWLLLWMERRAIRRLWVKEWHDLTHAIFGGKFTYNKMHGSEEYHLISLENCEIHETITQVKIRNIFLTLEISIITLIIYYVYYLLPVSPYKSTAFCLQRLINLKHLELVLHLFSIANLQETNEWIKPCACFDLQCELRNLVTFRVTM